MRGAILFALAAALSASTIWWGIGPHDEGLMLQAAHRMADGEVPYRDFWWNYGPGQPLVLAGLESIFGRSLVPWRVLRVLLDATVALLAYRLAVREVAPGLARPGGPVARGDASRRAAKEGFAAPPRWLSEGLPLLAWLAVAGAMAFPTGPHPNPAALALGLGAILIAPRRTKTAGALAGLAAVFRPEIGVAAALGAALSARDRARTLVTAAIVAVLGWLPFFVAAPSDLLDQTVGFLGIQGKQRLPFPLEADTSDPNKLLEFYLPLVLVAGCVLWLVRRGAVALAPLAVAGLLYLLGRTDEFHLVPLAVVLPVMLVAVAARERIVVLRVAAVAIVALIALHGLERKAGQLRHMPDLAKVPRGEGVRADAAEVRDLRRVLRAIGNDSVLVAPPRFSQVTVGNPLIYVLGRQENPTQHDVIQPGVVTEADVQREMVADLREARPELLVRWLDPRTAPEDNRSGRERGSTILDRYLARRFRGETRRYGVYEVRGRGG